MKNKKTLWIPLLIIAFSCFIVFKWGIHSGCSDCEEEIRKQNFTEIISDPENYIADILAQQKHGIKFPLSEPASAKLRYYSFWKGTRTLNDQQLKSVLKILNDSASYEWGEIGTPDFEGCVTFHDKSGACIGFTKLGSDGQTYSTPSTAAMKWGLLQTNELNVILEKE